MCKQEVHAAFSGCKKLQGRMLQASNLPNAVLCKVMQSLVMTATKIGATLRKVSVQSFHLVPVTCGLWAPLPSSALQENLLWVKPSTLLSQHSASPCFSTKRLHPLTTKDSVVRASACPSLSFSCFISFLPKGGEGLVVHLSFSHFCGVWRKSLDSVFLFLHFTLHKQEWRTVAENETRECNLESSHRVVPKGGGVHWAPLLMWVACVHFFVLPPSTEGEPLMRSSFLNIICGRKGELSLL